MMHTEQSMQERIRSFMATVYGWMSVGLALTAGIAYGIASSPELYMKLAPYNLYLILLQLGIVIALVFLINRISALTALILFLLYASSVGLTLSVIFMYYTHASIYGTFAITAGMFGAMSIYGYTTRADLTTMGSMSVMALFGLIIGMIVNIFLKSTAFHYFLSGIGIIIFVLLTAYDTQKLKQLAQNMVVDSQTAAKFAIFGALTLYLDFLNLFLFILNFLGVSQRR